MASMSQICRSILRGTYSARLHAIFEKSPSQICRPVSRQHFLSNVRLLSLSSLHPHYRLSHQRRHLSVSPRNRDGLNDETKGSTGNEEVEKLPLLIAKANLVLNENSKRREKIANAVADFAQEYSVSSKEERRSLFLYLVNEFGVCQSEVSSKASSLLDFLSAPETSAEDSVTQRKLIRQLEKLRQSLVPAYHQLFNAIGSLDNGVKLTIDIRSDLLSMIGSSSHSSTNLDESTVVRLKDLDRSLKELLSSWFSVGLLKLETVDWKSPCDLLQKVSEYERVHPVRSWADLKQRVGPYRRCFIFTHSSMPRDPVMVLNTYLSDSITRGIDEIIHRPSRPSVPDHAPLAASVDFPPDESPILEAQRNAGENPEQIQAAIFYSISNAQNGLKGVDLGHYLIKNAVKVLQQEFPHLGVFSTLSPIHGFKTWFMSKLSREAKFYTSRVPGGRKTLADDDSDLVEGLDEDRLFKPSELKSMMNQVMSTGYSEEPYFLMLFTSKLHVFLSTNKWYQNRELVRALEAPLQRLCVRYLYLEKHRGYALNPIANFHLRNGATLWRLNWLSDVSPKGLEHSFGMMVNYRYFPERTEENNRNYDEEKIIDISADVLEFLLPRT